MNQTRDLQLASYLVASGFSLRTIEGPPGRRTFVFDREFPTDLVLHFHSSPEKRLRTDPSRSPSWRCPRPSFVRAAALHGCAQVWMVPRVETVVNV